jgi:hypothetical protein
MGGTDGPLQNRGIDGPIRNFLSFMGSKNWNPGDKWNGTRDDSHDH